MSYGFFDKTYDGVIIKLPALIVHMNEDKLKPILDALANALDDETLLSKFHPDITKSAYEIQNYKDKQETIQQEKQQHENYLKRIEEKNIKLLNQDIIECVWKTEHDLTNNDETVYFPMLNGEEIRMDVKDILTGKGSVKASATRRLFELLPGLDYRQFMMKNFLVHGVMVLENHIDYPIQNVIRITGFSLSSYGFNVQVRLEILHCKIYSKSKKGEMQYLEFPVSFSKDGKGTLMVESPRTTYKNIDLSQYDFDHFRFTKKSTTDGTNN